MSESTKTKIKDWTRFAIEILITVGMTLSLFILNDIRTEVKDTSKKTQQIDSRVKIIEFIHKSELKDFQSNNF
jgi:hypothetical protein